jgi:putative membrane protein
MLQAFMHVSLFIAALCFWSALLALPQRRRWHAIPALLLTGKLACLLAALLVFAPRLLYEAHPHFALHATAADALADQQLAGLLMIVACPLSYLIAGVVFAAQILGDAEARGAVTPRPLPAVR